MPYRPSRPLIASALSSIGLAAALVVGCTSAPGEPVGKTPLSALTTPATPINAFNDQISIVQSAYPTTTPDSDPRQNYGTLYLPSGRQAPDSFPLVVLVHGGGWAAEAGAGVFNDYSRMLVRRGIAVYNVEYRRVGTGGGYPGTFADVAAAINHVPALQQQFPQLAQEANRVIAVGHSAGAQLAMFAATSTRQSAALPDPAGQFRPGTVISLAGPLDMSETVRRGNPRARKAMGGSPQAVSEHYTAVDPIQNVNPAINVVLVHGDADEVVPVGLSLRYADAVQRAGGTVSTTIIPGADHLSIVRPGDTGFREVVAIISRAAHIPPDIAAPATTTAPG